MGLDVDKDRASLLSRIEALASVAGEMAKALEGLCCGGVIVSPTALDEGRAAMFAYESLLDRAVEMGTEAGHG